MDALLLSRLQFAANISFHILFPTITIALAWVLLFFKWRFNQTGNKVWIDAYFFYVKIFALTFALGVVSGVTMSFQFGTNWPGFMETVGNIAGPLLAYEVLTAFFLEAAFVGIMLFGYSRVSNRMHTFATLMVAIGTTLSAFWILVLNSWMQTPVGFEMRDGQAYATDWLAIIFNPSMPYRFIHTLLASGLTVGFLITGLACLRQMYGERSPQNHLALRVGITLAAILAPLQIFVGDLHGLNTFEHQPAKVAAMEANWETGPNVPLVLIAAPDELNRRNELAITIPNGASLFLTHSTDGVVPGLNDFVGEHPPVVPIFFAFRIMVGIGVLMLILAWMGVWQIRRYDQLGGFTRSAFIAMTASGWVATLAGWYVSEIGRQPFLVQGVLKTADAVGPVPAATVGISFVAYVLLYLALLSAYIGVVLRLTYNAAQATKIEQANERRELGSGQYA